MEQVIQHRLSSVSDTTQNHWIKVIMYCPLVTASTSNSGVNADYAHLPQKVDTVLPQSFKDSSCQCRSLVY